MAGKELDIAFLRKQLMNLTTSSKLIALDSCNYIQFKVLGPKKYIGIRNRQVSA